MTGADYYRAFTSDLAGRSLSTAQLAQLGFVIVGSTPALQAFGGNLAALLAAVDTGGIYGAIDGSTTQATASDLLGLQALSTVGDIGPNGENGRYVADLAYQGGGQWQLLNRRFVQTQERDPGWFTRNMPVIAAVLISLGAYTAPAAAASSSSTTAAVTDYAAGVASPEFTVLTTPSMVAAPTAASVAPVITDYGVASPELTVLGQGGASTIGSIPANLAPVVTPPPAVPFTDYASGIVSPETANLGVGGASTIGNIPAQLAPIISTPAAPTSVLDSFLPSSSTAAGQAVRTGLDNAINQVAGPALVSKITGQPNGPTAPAQTATLPSSVSSLLPIVLVGALAWLALGG